MAKSITLVFRNVADIKATPRTPVIVYFTQEQWQSAIKHVKKGTLQPDLPALRYQSAPWDSQQIIVYPWFASGLFPRFKCKVVVKTFTLPSGVEVRYLTWECGFPSSQGCQIRQGDPQGRPIWTCENIDCSGQCQFVMGGDLANGFLQCQCR